MAIGLCTVLGKSDVLDILWKIITNAWQNYDKIMVRYFTLCLNWCLTDAFYTAPEFGPEIYWQLQTHDSCYIFINLII